MLIQLSRRSASHKAALSLTIATDNQFQWVFDIKIQKFDCDQCDKVFRQFHRLFEHTLSSMLCKFS